MIKFKPSPILLHIFNAFMMMIMMTVGFLPMVFIWYEKMGVEALSIFIISILMFIMVLIIGVIIQIFTSIFSKKIIECSDDTIKIGKHIIRFCDIKEAKFSFGHIGRGSQIPNILKLKTKLGKKIYRIEDPSLKLLEYIQLKSKIKIDYKTDLKEQIKWVIILSLIIAFVVLIVMWYESGK